MGERTLRKDVERLRGLGYPIDSVRGPAGGYRLGDHGRLPPLLLDDDEAVAVAVGLRAVNNVRGIEQASAQALAKLEHVLPDRLRRRVRALHDSTSTGPANTGTNVEDPPVDPALLAELAIAIRDHTAIRLWYRDDERGGGRAVPPGELAAALVPGGARARAAGLALPPGRLDAAAGARRRAVRPRPAPRRRLPGVRAARGGARPVGRCTPASRSTPRPTRCWRGSTPPSAWSRSSTTRHSVLVTGADSLEIIAVWIGMLGLDFHITDPPELVEHIRALSRPLCAGCARIAPHSMRVVPIKTRRGGSLQ